MTRVGTVPFLVAQPLSAGLQGMAGIELTVAPPAELGRALLAGELDVALASSVLALQHPQLHFWTEGPVIASRGPVRSVILLLRPGCAPEQIRTLALDPGSRSGRALARVILRERFSVLAQECEVAPEQAIAHASADAVQVIGDRALLLAQQHPDWQVIDLGEAWASWQELPFVFAGWMTRAGFSIEEVASKLRESAVEGLANREQLVARGVQELQRSADFVRRYLCEDLSYNLRPQEVRAALDAFRLHLPQPIA